MWHSRHLPKGLLWLCGLLVLGCLLGQEAMAQSFGPDPVEGLRRILSTPAVSAAERQRQLTQAVDALRRITDIHRALVLREWSFDDPNDEISAEVRKVTDEVRAQLRTRFVQRVRTALDRGDSTTQLAVIQMLAELGGSALDPQSAGGAVVKEELIRSRAAHFGPLLEELIEKGKPPVREAAALALGKINPQPKPAVMALGALLQKGTVREREAAARAMGDLVRVINQLTGTGSAVRATSAEVVEVADAILPVVSRGLADPSTDVRRWSAEAIVQVATALDNQVLPPPEAKDKPLERRQVAEERETLRPLMSAFRDQAPALAAAINDPDPVVRFLVRRAVEHMGFARERLQRREKSVLPSPAARLRRAATILVARQKAAPPAEADPLLAAFEVMLPALTAGLSDPYVRNRLAALDAIELYAGAARSAVPALTRTLEDPDRFVRWAAARILGRIGPTELSRTVPGLSRLLFDPDLGVNVAAAQALERYGESAAGAVPALAQALQSATDTEKRLAIIETLGSIGEKAAPAIPALSATLMDPYAKTRAAAATLLGQFGGTARAAVPALRRALNDTDPEVRGAASDALLNILEAGTE